MASDVRECDLTVETDRVISGYRKYNGWGGPMQFFFVAEFSKPFGKVVAVVDNGKPPPKASISTGEASAPRPILPQPTRKSCSSKSAFRP